MFRLLPSEERRVCKTIWRCHRAGTVPCHQSLKCIIYHHKQSRLEAKRTHKIWRRCQFLSRCKICKSSLQQKQPYTPCHDYCQGSGSLNLFRIRRHEITLGRCWHKHRQRWISVREIQWQWILPSLCCLLWQPTNTKKAIQIFLMQQMSRAATYYTKLVKGRMLDISNAACTPQWPNVRYI